VNLRSAFLYESIVAVAVLALVTTSCVGPGIQAQATVVRSDIDKARRSGAYQCAPRELAMAETSVDFAENELAQGDFIRAEQHIAIAVQSANSALANSKECAPKRVLIKTHSDKDGDTIVDDKDACPEKPEDFDEFEDEDGCPDPDNDKDDILDPLDNCPNEAGPEKTGGCPDKDGDGIIDSKDACPTQPEDKDGFEDEDGCPDVDNDKDGILDGTDACPDDAGPLENKGCPRKDSDGDGFFDDEDACVQKPGIAWPDNPKKNGCPPKLTLIEIEDDEIKIKQQVQFDTGKATIKPASAKLLGEVGLVVRSSPNIKKVSIHGHTDDVGEDDYNMKLSQDRAESVMRWLVEKEKVEADRLESKGFGETQPIASNRTSRGRQENRRSEFKVERATKVQQLIEPDAEK